MEEKLGQQLFKKSDCVALMLIFAVIYIWQGGYFQNCYCCAFIALAIFAFIAFALKKIQAVGIFEAAIIGVAALSVLTSLFVAENTHMALVELPKYIVFVPLLLIFSNEQYRNSCYISLIIVSIVAAIIGLLSCAGVLNVRDWALASARGIRLQSFLQYANTAAVMLGASLILMYRCVIDNNNRLMRIGMAILIFAFYVTSSAGAIACMIYVYIASFLFMSERGKLIPLGAMLIAGGFTRLLYGYLCSMGTLVILVWCVMAVSIIYAAGVFAEKHSFNINIKYRKIYFFIVTLVFGVMGSFAITHIGTFLERALSDIDALKLILKHPLGIGAGNWSFWQDTVKRIGYEMKYIHCGYLQIYFAGGPIAFVIFTAMCAAAMIHGIKNRSGNIADDLKISALALMLLHMAVDVDINFTIYNILLCALLAEQNMKITKKIPKIPQISVIAVSGIVGLLFSAYGSYDAWANDRISEYESSYKFTEAENVLDQKIKLQPSDSSSLIRKAAIVELDENRQEEAYQLYIAGGRLDPHNQSVNIERYCFEKRNGISVHDKIKRLKELLSGCEINTELYTELMQTYIYGWKQGEITSDELLTEGKSIYDRIEEINNKTGVLRFYDGVPMNVDTNVLTEIYDLCSLSADELDEKMEKSRSLNNSIATEISQMNITEKARAMIICPETSINSENGYGVIMLDPSQTGTSDELRAKIKNLKEKYPSSMIAVSENGSENSTIQGRKETNLPDYVCRGYFENYSYDDSAYDLGENIGQTLSDYDIDLCFGFQAAAVQNRNAYLWENTFTSSENEIEDITKKYVSGMQSKNVYTVIEQFPSYANNSENPQTATMVSDFNKERRLSNIYAPIRAAIERNVGCIMMSHLLVPNNSTSVINAEFSKYYTTKILRNELGFNNVILTDILTANAVTDNVTYERAILYAVNAGCDLLYVTENPELAASSIEKYVAEGKISERQLDNALVRILSLKYNNI